MTLTAEQKIEQLEKILGEVDRKVTVINAFIALQQSHESWIPKEVLMALTGLTSASVNTYASQGKILKRGTLYSYRSYLEYLEIYPTRKGSVMKKALYTAAMLFILTFFGSWLPMANANEVNIDMHNIAMIESSGCVHNQKIGDGGGSNGCHQISADTLKEYNQFNRTKYTKKHLMNDEVSYKIAYWYLHKRIPQMLRAFKKPVNTKNILWSYNAGIGRCVEGFLPEKTKVYLQKYDALSKAKSNKKT